MLYELFSNPSVEDGYGDDYFNVIMGYTPSLDGYFLISNTLRMVMVVIILTSSWGRPLLLMAIF